MYMYVTKWMKYTLVNCLCMLSQLRPFSLQIKVLPPSVSSLQDVIQHLVSEQQCLQVQNWELMSTPLAQPSSRSAQQAVLPELSSVGKTFDQWVLEKYVLPAQDLIHDKLSLASTTSGKRFPVWYVALGGKPDEIYVVLIITLLGFQLCINLCQGYFKEVFANYVVILRLLQVTIANCLKEKMVCLQWI